MSSGKTPHILITRLSHIGDCILTLPMLCAIRRKMPDAYIAWAVESPTQQFLNLHPDIDEVIVVPKHWAKKPQTWPALFNKLRQSNFDIVFDPQGITKSAALARISGAKTRIGIRGQWGRELSPYLNNCLIETTAPHIVDRSLELLTAIGVRNPKVEFRLPVCSSSQQAVKQFLQHQQIDETFVVINPGASWESKRWEVDRFAIVASHLYREHGLTSVVVWAGKEEKAMAERIVSINPDAAVMAGKTSLLELAALCKQASFLISGDSGPLHVATAMGTQCVGLYGTTRPEDSGAYGSQHVAIQKWYQSGSCRQRRNATNDAMRDIMASDVIAAFDGLMDQQSSRRHIAA